MKVQASASSSSLLRGAVLALKAVDKPIKRDISRETREQMNDPWKQQIAKYAAGSTFDNAVFGKGARVAAGNPARLIAASSKRAFKGGGGFIPDSMARSVEFPANLTPSRKSPYVRKYKGSSQGHKVKRRTVTGYPDPRPGGRVVYRAVSDVMPRFTSLWVQIIARNVYKSVEGK